MKDIFSYTDYREFLRDYYQEKKEKHSHFSHRAFSRMAGLGGQSYLRMVMSGQRNLSPATIRQFIKGLKLKRKEGEYFENLVLYNQARLEKERDVYFDRLTSLKPLAQVSELEKDQLTYLANKYYVVLREMVNLPDFKEDPEWIAKRMNQQITPREVKLVLDTLVRLGLVSRDKQGKLNKTNTTLTTLATDASLEIFNYHRSILSEAKDAVLRIPSKKREIIAMTVPVQEDSIEFIKDLLKDCQEKIMQYVNKKGDNYHDVYQVNIQFYPVTHKEEETK